MRIEVIYAVALKPGDLYAGTVDRAAPTRPVQVAAAALRITEVAIAVGDDGRRLVRCQAGGLTITALPVSAQCLVIRTN